MSPSEPGQNTGNENLRSLQPPPPTTETAAKTPETEKLQQESAGGQQEKIPPVMLDKNHADAVKKGGAMVESATHNLDTLK